LGLASLLVIFVLTSDFSAHYEICEQTHSGVKECGSYNVLSYVLHKLWTAFDALNSAITAIATAFIAWFTLSLRQATDKLWDAGERTLKTTERAFIHLDGFNFGITTKEDMKETEILEGEPEWCRKHPGLVLRRFDIQPRWKNSGTTPTRNMKIQIGWRTPTYAIEVPKYIYQIMPQPFFVAAGAVEPSFVIDMPWAQAIINASFDPAGFQPLILIWGRADYEDMFGEKHFVEWCHQLRLSRSGGGRLSASTIQWGDYNRTDSDLNPSRQT
jgi:hypothetical protein